MKMYFANLAGTLRSLRLKKELTARDAKEVQRSQRKTSHLYPFVVYLDSRHHQLIFALCGAKNSTVDCFFRKFCNNDPSASQGKAANP